MADPIVLVPSYKGIDHNVETCLHALERHGIEVHRCFGPATIDRTRSQLAQYAVDRKCDPLLWIDDDIVFQPHDAERFIDASEDFLAATFAQRSQGGKMVVGNAGPLVLGAGGDIVEVDWCGFGFVRTSASVFEAVGEKLDWCEDHDGTRFKAYFAPIVEPPAYYAEDISFCRRARAAGVTVMCDTTVRLFHVGTYLYSWEDTLPQQRLPTMLADAPKR